MPLFENLEKLINEHGSAAILRERLGLASDKYATLEAKADQLTRENEDLKTQLADHYKEIQRLRGLAVSVAGKLSEDEEKVLIIYAEVHEWIPVSSIARRLSISKMKAQYLVDQLLGGAYLQPPMVVFGDQEIGYHIHHKGREYVIKHDLVN